jgi:hypothetical protein
LPHNQQCDAKWLNLILGNRWMPFINRTFGAFVHPWQPRILFLSIALLVGAALMHPVLAPTVGLDPSWQLALSKAHGQHLDWGKDIIFTYGPLGYLFFGSLGEPTYLEMQLARYVLNVGWLYLSLMQIAESRPASLRVVQFILLIVIPSFLSDEFYYAESKFILIAQLMILGNFKTLNYALIHQPILGIQSYSYGVISSVFLLTKFNFGLLTIVGLWVSILINIALALKARSRLETTRSLSALNWLSLGFLTGNLLWTTVARDHPWLGGLIVSLVGLIAIPLVVRWKQPKWPVEAECSSLQPISLKQSLRVTGILAMAAIGVVGMHPNLRSFIIGSLQITQGYSQSMGLVGPQNELVAGVVLTLGILMLGGLLVRWEIHSLGVVLPTLLWALMSFKHGFIRHDWAHVPLFAIAMPAYYGTLGALLPWPIPSQSMAIVRWVWRVLVAGAIALFLAFGSGAAVVSHYYDLNGMAYLSRFSPASLAQRWSQLLSWQGIQAALLTQKAINLQSSQIDSQPAQMQLQGKTVDVLPWEVSLVEANQLRWQPSPIFQAYSTYTQWLDRRNLEFYQRTPPDTVLYSFAAIDGRHPYFDQPQTTLFQLCHYQPDPNVPPFGTASAGWVALLQPRPTPLCAGDRAAPVGQPQAARWQQQIELPLAPAADSRHLLLAQIDLPYSPWGKLYSLVFRTPPVFLQVFYATGTVATYRLVLDTAKAGLLVSNLPTQFDDSLKLWQGDLNSGLVREIALTTPNPAVFRPAITVHFSQVALHSPPLQKSEFSPSVGSPG